MPISKSVSAKIQVHFATHPSVPMIGETPALSPLE